MSDVVADVCESCGERYFDVDAMRRLESAARGRPPAYNARMVRALRKQFRIQPGGRIEVVSPDLPDGAEVEVIVLVHETAAQGDCIGSFRDDAELLDRIIEEAMADRERPLRQARG